MLQQWLLVSRDTKLSRRVTSLLLAVAFSLLAAAGCSGDTTGATPPTSPSPLPAIQSTAGSQVVFVPELAGLTEVDARKAGERLGLVVDLQFVSAPELLPGTVVAVQPDSGSAMAQGDTLTLVIAGPNPSGEVEQSIVPEAVGRLLESPDFLGAVGRGRALTFVVWAETDLSYWEEKLEAVGVESPSFLTCTMTGDAALAVLEDVRSGWWKDDPATFYAFRPDPNTCTILISSLRLNEAEIERLVDRHGDQVSFQVVTSTG